MAKKTEIRQQQQHPVKRGWFGRTVLLVLVLAGAIAAGYSTGLRQSPLGTPLPGRPRQVVVTKGVSTTEMSTVDGRIAERVLKLMAPQADGTPPLYLRLFSSRGGYSMQFPPGSQLLELPDSYYKKELNDVQVTFKYGQPLFLVKSYLKPRFQNESYMEAARRLYKEVAADASTGIEPQHIEPVAGCPFARCEFIHPGPLKTGEYRQIFVTPYGNHLLTIDFYAKSEHAALAKNQVDKIMASFKTQYPPERRILAQDQPGA